MAVKSVNEIRSLNIRAQLPKYFRIGALAVLLITLVVVGIGYYRAKSNEEFRMVGFPTELSKEVIATVHGYERRESDGEILKHYIRADKATTFSDNHQELENVYLQVFANDGEADEITARKAVYVPEENKNFTGYFAGDVVILSRDKLTLRTEQVTYTRSSDVATAEEDVEFERLNIRGRSTGASVNFSNKLLHLVSNVQFDVEGTNGSFARINGGTAHFDQTAERLEVLKGALLEKRDAKEDHRFVESKLKAGRLVAHLIEPEAGSRVVDRVELFDSVGVERRDNDSVVTLNAQSGSFSRISDRFEMNQDVTVRLVRSDSAFDGRASKAVYEPGGSRVALRGSASLQNETSSISGDSIAATLSNGHSIDKAVVTGNARVRQTSAEYVTEISAGELTGAFDESGVLSRADALGASEIVRTSANDGSRLTVNAAAGLHTVFRGADAVHSMDSEGRTMVRLDMPDNGTDSSNRTVAADSVKTVFRSAGKNLMRTEAVGNAEFVLTPHRAGDANYSIRTNSPRFDCDFYSGRNDPRTCIASKGAKTVRTPTVRREGRGEQTLTSNTLTLAFDERTRAIGRLDANGKAKFSELDRTAIADSFQFNAGDEVVRLRGGEPTAWDSTARIKAKEIDWDTRNGSSAYRGGVNSTYYSNRSVGNASPFADESKPFYVTAENAELDHRNEIGVFSGNARGWQASNFVRGDRLELRKRESKLNALGRVHSLLYKVRNLKGDPGGTMPVSAAAVEMRYDGARRTIDYSGGVDIRQGSDRMSGGAASIKLDERNEMTETRVESNVAIVQSGRKAFGEGFVYTAIDDRVFLRGRPARVEDNERGASQGEELVIYLSDNRMSGEGRSRANPAGRVRNVYKIN